MIRTALCYDANFIPKQEEGQHDEHLRWQFAVQHD